MKHLKTFESHSNINGLDDIKDIFLELKDEGWEVEHVFDVDDRFPFTDEFLIFKRGDSGYYLNGVACELFNVSDINREILRFVDLCEINNDKFRVLASDVQYTLNLTSKIDNLEDIDHNDILSSSHLHFKDSNDIDLKNVQFVVCQILK